MSKPAPRPTLRGSQLMVPSVAEYCHDFKAGAMTKEMTLATEFLDPNLISGAVTFLGDEQYVQVEWSEQFTKEVMGLEYTSGAKLRTQFQLELIYGKVRPIFREVLNELIGHGSGSRYNKKNASCQGIMEKLGIDPQNTLRSKFGTSYRLGKYPFLDATWEIDCMGMIDLGKMAHMFKALTPDGLPMPRQDLIMFLAYAQLEAARHGPGMHCDQQP